MATTDSRRKAEPADGYNGRAKLANGRSERTTSARNACQLGHRDVAYAVLSPRPVRVVLNALHRDFQQRGDLSEPQFIEERLP